MKGKYIRTAEIREETRQRTFQFYKKLKKAKLPYPRQGMKHSFEAREKIKMAQIRYNQRLKKEGKPHPQTGKKMSESAKSKMSLAKKGRCSGNHNPQWRGGRRRSSGYILIWSPHHPYGCPSHEGGENYVLEHRLVVEKILGRFLKPSEVVHHLNSKKDDNRPENLLAFNESGVHSKLHLKKESYIPPPESIIFDGRKL